MSPRARFDRWYRRKLNGGNRIHRLWWECSDRGYWWLWRPACWLRGYHTPTHVNAYGEHCAYCGKTLWSRSRDGGLNPFVRPVVDRAPLRKVPRRLT